MQPTTRFHDRIANPILQEAYFVFHQPIALHPTDRLFNPDSDGRDRTSACLFRGREFPTRGCFLGLEDRPPLTRLPLEAHILIETTARWEGIACQLGEACIMGLPFIGGTQDTQMTGLINHKEVFDRRTLLLAAIVFLLVLWIGWAVERSLRTIMPKRGDSGTPAVRLAASITAKSWAVRAGRSSWCATA
jgi:hypothetical protein